MWQVGRLTGSDTGEAQQRSPGEQQLLPQQYESAVQAILPQVGEKH